MQFAIQISALYHITHTIIFFTINSLIFLQTVVSFKQKKTIDFPNIILTSLYRKIYFHHKHISYPKRRKLGISNPIFPSFFPTLPNRQRKYRKHAPNYKSIDYFGSLTSSERENCKHFCAIHNSAVNTLESERKTSASLWSKH